MKKVLLMMLALIVFVGCESEYDKMSEYEKMVSDVGVSSKISAEDALKITPLWSVSKIIYSSQPNGQGETNVYNHEEPLYGAYTHYFSFDEKMRMYSFYPTFGLALTHRGIYIDYEYQLGQNNDIVVDCNSTVKPFRNDIMIDCWVEKARLVAYNETNIAIEIFDSGKSKYPYATFLLKPSTKIDKNSIDKVAANIDQFYLENKHAFDEVNGK